jgi:hypothetical protein
MTFRPRLITRLALAFVGFALPALALVLVANIGLARLLDSSWVVRKPSSA